MQYILFTTNALVTKDLQQIVLAKRCHCSQNTVICSQLCCPYLKYVLALSVLPGEIIELAVKSCSASCAHAGFAAYSAYAPTKYAVRGLADTLRNEVSCNACSNTSPVKTRMHN